jgi:hypothetical protein
MSYFNILAIHFFYEKLSSSEAKAIADMFRQDMNSRGLSLYISKKKYNMTHVSEDEAVGKSDMSSLRNLLLVRAGDVIILALNSGDAYTDINNFNILVRNAGEHFKNVRI